MIVISGEIGIDKPDLAIFHHAFREINLLPENLNLLPEETLYLGDSLTHEVQGVLNAGMIPVLIIRNILDDPSWIHDYHHPPPQEVILSESSRKPSINQPYQIIHSLEELDDLLP